AWLADPAAFIPHNRMIFLGLEDAQARADLIAYLEQVSESGQAARGQAPGGMGGGGMGGMMGSAEMADLRHDVGPNNRVARVRYCGDTYTVDVTSGESHEFWEFNLRFKTDSSDKGPAPGHPVLIPSGMMGDRAFLIFADPAEISRLIEKRC
ncbi:MAG: c-type cytochrome, partial [Geminicoccaceae bacterium]